MTKLTDYSKINSSVPSYTNMGVCCTFIDSDDYDYIMSMYIIKLTNTYIEFYFNVEDDSIILLDDIFRCMSVNPTMIVNYLSPTNPDIAIAELWFKNIKYTHINNLFEFDDLKTSDNTNDMSLRTVKIYYEYESIEYMKTDLASVRKSKLNKLTNKDTTRQTINSDNIK